jgi:hypothetical protein
MSGLCVFVSMPMPTAIPCQAHAVLHGRCCCCCLAAQLGTRANKRVIPVKTPCLPMRLCAGGGPGDLEGHAQGRDRQMLCVLPERPAWAVLLHCLRYQGPCCHADGGDISRKRKLLDKQKVRPTCMDSGGRPYQEWALCSTSQHWLLGWVGLHQAFSSMSLSTQWPARRKHGRKRAEEEERPAWHCAQATHRHTQQPGVLCAGRQGQAEADWRH